MVDNPYEPTSHDEGRKQGMSPLVSNLLTVLAVIFIVGLLMMLLLPMRRNSRPAYERMLCQNNLKQISIALHSYEDEYGSLPPAYTVDAEGRPLHSWRSLILPFLEEETPYEDIDFSKPWDAPENKQLLDECPEAYRCLSSDISASETTYQVIISPKSLFPGKSVRSIKSVAAQTSSIVMVVEVPASHSVPWMAPSDLTMQSFSKILKEESFPHYETMQYARADGSVTSTSETTPDEEKQTIIASVEADDDPDSPPSPSQ